MNEIALRKKQNLLRTKIAEILRREIDDPKLNSISITRLETDKKLESVKVFFTSFLSSYSPADLERELNKVAGFIRHKLVKSLHTRSAPNPKFIYDRSLENLGKVDEILKKINPSPSADF